MINKTEYFDFDMWWGKIFTSTYEVRDFLRYINDKDAISFHFMKNKTIKEFNSKRGTIELAPEKDISPFCAKLHAEFENIGTKYLNNLIVLQFAVTEQILEQSVFLFLSRNNNLLKRTEQINPEFQIHKTFDLGILMKTELTKDVIKLLCTRASKYIVTGKIEKSFNRIERLVGLKYSADIIRFLQTLQDNRNSVVHETTFKALEVGFFHELSNVLQEVLIGLENKFKEYDIRFERTFIW